MTVGHSGSLRICIISVINSRRAVNLQRNRRKEFYRVDQHKFVALSCLWTSEERTQIILQQVKKEKSKHSLPLRMNWMIMYLDE